MNGRISRRRLMVAGSSLVALSGCGDGQISSGDPTMAAPAAPKSKDGPLGAPGALDYADLRVRWVRMLTGADTFNPAIAPFNTMIEQIRAEAQAQWTAMNKSVGRTHLWGDLATTAIVDTWYSSERLRTMALAWAQPGCSLFGNTTLRSDIVGALQWISDNRYNSSITKTNWWEWEIGTPHRLLDIMVLMYGSVSATLRNALLSAIDHFSPNPANAPAGSPATGANQAWISWTHIGRGILGDSDARITAARDALIADFGYTDDGANVGDGFYRDGSFLQHAKHPYNGSYGVSMLSQTADIMHLLQLSPWALGQAQWANPRQWVFDAFEPLIAKGAIMDMVRGRGSSRSYQDDHATGHIAIQALTRMATYAPTAQGDAMRSLAKALIQADTYRTVYQHDKLILSGKTNLDHARILRQWQLDAAIPAAAERTGFFHFHRMDRVVHRRPTFSLAISTYSNRIYNYESINGENLKGHFTANGMVYLYNSDAGHFSDGFWPTVNPNRLPGVTCDYRPLPNAVPAQQTLGQSWVGGAAFPSSGVVGMDLSYDAGKVKARKSWFCFGDYILCLGAQITGTSGYRMETTIENRSIGVGGTDVVTMNSTSNQILQTANVTPPDLSAARWIHIAGVGGYAFPPDDGGSTHDFTIMGARVDRSGRWTDINDRPTSDPTLLTRRYITLWFDHGVNPTNARYAYVMLPGKTASETAAYAASPGAFAYTILENSASAQAAQGPYGITAVNLWVDGSRTFGPITANKRCSIGLAVYNGQIRFWIADPTQSQTGTITVTVQVANDGVVSTEPGLTVTRNATSATFSFNPTNLKGRTLLAELSPP